MATHRACSKQIARVAGLLIAGLVALGACASPATPHWTGEGVHLVDGYWIQAEIPCDLASTDLCVNEVRAAETSLAVDPKAVVHTATSSLPVWAGVGSDGRVTAFIFATSGPIGFAVLDLADGSRRVAGVGCFGVPEPDGSHSCMTQPLDDYRDGHTPTRGSPGP